MVLPEVQGQGIGKQQIHRIIGLLRTRGVQTIQVTTGEPSFFKPARRMYESCGFKEIGRGEKDGQAGFCVIKYQRVL